MVFLTVNFAQASNVRSEVFTVYFSSGSSLGFQHGGSYLLLNINSGSLNSSEASLTMNEYSGHFVFLSNTTTIIKISYTPMTVKVAGDNGNRLRAIANETSVSIGANDRVEIIWNITTTIFFPLRFLLGIVGLFSTFGGVLYGVKEIKDKQYYDGFRTGAIFVCIGVALVLAWLW